MSLRDGLERTIAWTRENFEWIESCMTRHAESMAAAGAPLQIAQHVPLAGQPGQ